MKSVLVLAATLILFSCAPVLDRELMKEGQRNVSLNELRANPDAYKGKLFILGGVIVETRLTANGSELEILSKPVDKYGVPRDTQRTMGRFLAVYPRDKGLLDPVVYKEGREVTLAGDFVDARKGKIGDYEYVYPVFEIRQIHLYEEEPNYAFYPYPYPYSYYPYGFYDPYWYNPYWAPWRRPPGWW